MAELKGNKYGIHRVIEPQGVLTQAAWKIDNDMTKRYSNEIICNVTSLNIDPAWGGSPSRSSPDQNGGSPCVPANRRCFAYPGAIF